MAVAQQAGTSVAEGRLFLPDLCSARSVLVVVVVAELLAVVLSLAAYYYEGVNIERLALSSLFVQWVALTSAAMLCALRERINRQSLAMASCLVVLLVVVDTFVFSLVSRQVIQWVTGTAGVTSVWGREVAINAVIAAIIGGTVMRYLFVNEQLRDKGEAELQARIQALQSRIRPHFLFNSMNIIASLISVDPDTAEQVVEDLARLFRASLKETGNDVPLSEEVSLCKRYVRIEQLRMGERLQVGWDIAPAVRQAKIPLLTLQPLLENAIYHGIQPLADGGLVTVAAILLDGRVRLSVRNPCPAGESTHRGNRMALDNIRHRLQALYGEEASVEARPVGDQYQVLISYPFKNC
ncbi:MAG: sensor histidine kinase [Gammaproteobacteria bacterium]|nr:sensor histidine kinase [Gammaproteobacteria bacterium]MBQ0774961.1 sensor histidine kinase [Gammaproteobacteria bacterium]|tara:strand:- start:20196 stop:21254 length:1059 start_codon:yes stop_codon:yes gene_type:complete